MKQTEYNKFQYKATNYVKQNWGVPFIIGFMLLLVGAAAFSLNSGLSSLADNVAVYAFYALILGVVLQLVCFMKYGEKTEAEAL
jgi:hypothetical protein